MKKRTILIVLKSFFLIFFCILTYSLLIKPVRAELCWCICNPVCGMWDGTQWVYAPCCSFRVCETGCWSTPLCSDEYCFNCTNCTETGGSIDDTPPQCRVIVNPTSENVNSLLTNRNFEIPVYQKHEMNCPNQWYNRDDGGRNDDEYWCDYGLSVVVGRPPPCGDACLNQRVELGYPHYRGYQPIYDLSGAGNVLYRLSGWAKGYYAALKFNLKGDKEGTFVQSFNKNWQKLTVLGWRMENPTNIVIDCYKCDEDTGGAEFDLISLEKLTGVDQVDDLDVDLYVAFHDNRRVQLLRHWNEGETAPDWDSEDSNVINFGPNYLSSSNPISHTLSGYGDQTIKVEVMDGSGNVGDCEVTVGSAAPTGTITGKVYQNEEGKCNGNTPVPGEVDWQVECGNLNDYYRAEKQTDGITYRCMNKDGGYDLLWDTYIVGFETPLPGDWQGVSGCSQDSVNLEGTSATFDNLYLWQGVSAWFQTEEGDVHSQGNIFSYIPTDVVDAGGYFCLNGEGGTPGVVSFGLDGDFDFKAGSGKGEEAVSEKEWLAEASFPRNSYGYLTGLLEINESTPDNFDDFSSLSGDGVYYSQDDVALNGSFPGGKVVVVVNGNVDINSNISVNNGDSLVIIAKNNLNIAGSVGEVHGIFLADIISTGTGDTPFVGQGSFVAREVNLDRGSSGDPFNENDPIEQFTYRADLIMNSLTEIWISPYTWQELLP